MLIADRPVPVFPAPVTYRSQRTSKTALGHDLHHHVLASARPSPHVGQAEKVELGAIRLRMPCALRPSRAKVDKTRLVGVERKPEHPARWAVIDHLIDGEHRAFVLSEVERDAKITLHELTAALADRGLIIHPASVGRFLHREGKSFKKRMARPSARGLFVMAAGLHQRIWRVG